MKIRNIALATVFASLVAATAAHASITAAQDQLAGASFMTYSNVTFQGGQQAVVVVKPAGNTEMHLSVFDQNNHLINQTYCPAAGCYVRWTPAWTGNFNIVVANLGSDPTEYGIAVN